MQKKRWHLKSNVPKAKTVITYYEIIAITIVFITVLYLLYPGDKIRTLSLRETKNIDLTILYLKQIIKIYPNDLENWDRLLSLYLKISDLDNAYKLIEEMEHSPNEDIRNKSLYLKYNFSKQLFYQTKKEQYKSDLIKLFPALLNLFSSDLKKLEIFYKDYLSFGLPEFSKRFAKQLFMELRKSNPDSAKKWLNEYYKQSLATNDLDAIIEYLNTMITLEPNNTVYIMKLADIYTSKGDLAKAIELYNNILERLPFNEKKSMVIKIIKAYQSLGNNNEAAAILKKHENLFTTNDDKKLVIQMYLSMNRLDYASEFSKKIIGE